MTPFEFNNMIHNVSQDISDYQCFGHDFNSYSDKYNHLKRRLIFLSSATIPYYVGEGPSADCDIYISINNGFLPIDIKEEDGILSSLRYEFDITMFVFQNGRMLTHYNDNGLLLTSNMSIKSRLNYRHKNGYGQDTISSYGEIRWVYDPSSRCDMLLLIVVEECLKQGILYDDGNIYGVNITF